MKSFCKKIGGLLLAAGILCGLPGTWMGAQEVKITNYSIDDQIFANPERGFYEYTYLHALDPGIGYIRENGETLVWGKIDLEPYRETSVLPQTFLDALQQGFTIARNQGVKVIVRGSYGDTGPCGDYTCYTDPPKETIKSHITQLSPIFTTNADVIALFEAGFVGPWGEWHTTTIAEDYDQGREILLHLLGAIPGERMVVVRYPYLKQQIFKTASGFEIVDASNAYTTANVARVGHHNDCFLSSESDYGTYGRGTMTREEETEYISGETLYTPYGGETCALHELNDCARAVSELEELHATYLNSGWHPDVLNKWKTQGCCDEIKKRLGARFVISQSRVSATACVGGSLSVAFDLRNEGFASFHNRRKVELILQHEVSGQKWTFEVDKDPREWKAGQPLTVQWEIAVPSAMPEGSYRLYLNLPDFSPSLQSDPRYAYRIASQNMWEESSGYNRLTSGIQIQDCKECGAHLLWTE